MSVRGLNMVKLAKMLAERANAKENVRGFENGTFQGEDDKQGKTHETEVHDRVDLNNKNKLIDEHFPTFEPSVIHETQSSMNGHNIDIELLKTVQQVTENDDDFENILSDKPAWMDSDDSEKDPDYLYSQSNSSSENLEEIVNMGAQKEAALATPKPQNMKKLRSKLRNSGKSYQSVSGKTIKARAYKPFEACRNKCNEMVGIEKIELLFNHYWSLGSYDQRILYIASLIGIEDKKCNTLFNSTNRKRKREHTMKYSLEVDGIVLNVCKKHFQQCFNETDSFIKTVIQKKIGCPSTPFKTMRGKCTPANKIDLIEEDKVKKHISKFPAYESHYSRRDTSKKYLPASLNISLMHRLYASESSNPVSLSKYTQIFKTMGLKFKAPKLDTCSTCDTFVSKIKVAETDEEKKSLIEMKKIHLDKAEMAYEAKRKDKVDAKTSNYMKTFAFDLQQCLPTPFLRNSISFYKRQLWTFNLTVHDLESNYAKCFMWHEAMARCGGNEISSCVYKLLKTLPEETKSVTFYSDSCSGQNKNSFVAAMFITFISTAKNIEYIDHKFLEPGHTHMECDSDHALIERMKKNTNVRIEIPRDWYQFVNTVGAKIEAVEMKNDDFYDFSNFSKTKFAWKRFNEDCVKFTWNEVRWFRYTKNSDQVLYKHSLDTYENFKTIKVGKRGAVLKINDLSHVTELPKISQEKKKDLMDLKQYINPDFHSFYDNLASNMDEPNIHPDLTDVDKEEDI